MIFFGIYSLFLQTVAERCGTDTSDRSNNMTLWVSFMFKDKYLTMYILSVLELLSIKELYWTYRQYLTTHSMSTYYNTYSYTHEQVTTCIRVAFLLLFYTLTFFSIYTARKRPVECESDTPRERSFLHISVYVI